MKIVHKDFKFTAGDIVLLKAYMDKFVNIGLKQDKPVITYVSLLIIASILFLVAATDLIIKRIFRKQKDKLDNHYSYRCFYNLGIGR